MVITLNIHIYFELLIHVFITLYPFSHLGCNVNTWPDIKDGQLCGDCYALININSYGTCRTYCQSLGLQCLKAFEESGNSCTIKYEADCDTDFDWTSDALCQCTDETDNTGNINSKMKISTILNKSKYKQNKIIMRCVLQFIPDCPGGYVCDVNNFCVATPCGSQNDCKSNQGCVHGMCKDIKCR